MYSVFSLHVDCMSTLINPDLRTTDAPASSRPRAVVGRRRRGATCRVGAQPYQSLVTGDRHDIEIMELLADILACVFAESQKTGIIDLPSGSQVTDTTTFQTEELIAA